MNCAFFRKFVLVIFAFQVSSFFTLTSVPQAEELNVESEILKPKVAFRPVEKRLDEELQEIFLWVAKQPCEQVTKSSMPTKISKYACLFGFLTYLSSLAYFVSMRVITGTKTSNYSLIAKIMANGGIGGFGVGFLSLVPWQFFSNKDVENFTMECTPEFLKELDNKFDSFLKKLSLSSSKNDCLAVMKKISAFVYNRYNSIVLKKIHYHYRNSYDYSPYAYSTETYEYECLSNNYLQTLSCLKNVNGQINKRLKELGFKKENIDVPEKTALRLLEKQLVACKPLIKNISCNYLEDNTNLIVNNIKNSSEEECLMLLDVESNFIYSPHAFVPNTQASFLFESSGPTGKTMRVMNILLRPVRLAIEKRLEEIYKEDLNRNSLIL